MEMAKPGEWKFSRFDWIRLAASALIGAGFAYFWPMNFLPGAGLSVSLWLILLLGVLGRKNRILSVYQRLMIALSALLSGGFFVFASASLRLVCLPVAAGVTVMTLFSVNGALSCGCADAGAAWEAAKMLPGACFRHMDKPFIALSRLGKAKGVLVGALISVPVVAVAAALLMSADEVFAAAGEWLLKSLGADFGGTWFLRLFFMLFLTLAAFSFFFSLSDSREISVTERNANLPASVFAVPFALLFALYALFVAVQFLYLFGGKASASMNYGYAQYARRGFFELAAVCAFNLALTFLAFRLCGFKPVLRVLAAGLYGATFVMLASAAYRMALYVSVYYWSFLRLLTLWGIFAMGVVTLAACVKLACPEKGVHASAFLIVVTSFLAFAYMNPEGRIAEWNIRISVQEMSPLDREYLESFSPDALPVLLRMADEYPEAEEISGAIARNYQKPAAFEWSATCAFLPDE